MPRLSGTFLAFSETDLFQLTQQRLAQAYERIERISEKALKQNEAAELAEPIIKEFALNAPSLDFNNIRKTNSEQSVQDSSGIAAVIAARTGESRQVRRQVITYHIPLSGDSDLLRCRPSIFTLSAPYVYVGSTSNLEELCFDVVRPSNNPDQVQQDLDQVRAEAERNISLLKSSSVTLAEDVNKFNSQLQAEVPSRIATKKLRLQSNDDFLSQL